jgi:predicted transcriptional regulator
LHVGDEVGAGLIAAYLYDKLKKGRATKLRIDRTEVEIDKGEIARVLSEHIEQDKLR